MRDVAILGAGAIGSTLGAVLAEIGRDVVLVGREGHVRAITDEGLEFRDAARNETESIGVDASTSLEPASTVILGMKTPDVPEGLDQVQEVAPDATVVPIQNGVRADEMAAEAVGRKQVVGGLVLFHAEFLEPGRVTLTRSEPLLFGNPWGASDEHIDQVAGLFDGNDRVPVQVHDDLQGARWTKLLVNLNNALPAITGQSVQTIYKDDPLARIATGAIWEGAKTVRTAGRRLASLPTVPRLFFVLVSYVPHSLGWRLLRSRVLATLGTDPVRPSTLQSVLRGGANEIDYLNGEIVALGEEIGHPTPINRGLVELVHEVEEREEFLDRDAVLDHIG